MACWFLTSQRQQSHFLRCPSQGSYARRRLLWLYISLSSVHWSLSTPHTSAQVIPLSLLNVFCSPSLSPPPARLTLNTLQTFEKCSILVPLIFIIENICTSSDYIAHRYQSKSLISTSKSFLFRTLLYVPGPTLRPQDLSFLPRTVRWQRTKTIYCSTSCWAATLLTSIFRSDGIIR